MMIGSTLGQTVPDVPDSGFLVMNPLIIHVSLCATQIQDDADVVIGGTYAVNDPNGT